MIKHYIDNVKKVILVASGKGGVGKSTISVALAEILQKQGNKVGIVDADIYGPSIPTMLGVSEKPELLDKKFIPIKHKDFQIMSMGFLVPEDGPVAWRGPMATKSIYQILSATLWEDLDYLIIDMPPGTGDIHLSILENYNIDEVYMVTSPSLVSLKDVERAIALYKKFELNIVGLVENMVSDMFPGNAAEVLSKKYDIPVIGRVPLKRQIAESGDKGDGIGEFVEEYLVL
jgi:ATP-binding protein involved in chromosome partitioning